MLTFFFIALEIEDETVFLLLFFHKWMLFLKNRIIFQEVDIQNFVGRSEVYDRFCFGVFKGPQNQPLVQLYTLFKLNKTTFNLLCLDRIKQESDISYTNVRKDYCRKKK